MLESLSIEQLIELIKTEFADVTREGGISWREVDAWDSGGQEYLFDLAKKIDIEEGWEELVNSATWDIYEWSDNWSELDPVSFRYYLAAAMVRDLQSDQDYISYHRFCSGNREKFSEFTKRQKIIVAEFVQYKLDEDRKVNFPEKVGQPAVDTSHFSANSQPDDSEWCNAYLHWKQFLSSDKP